MIPFGETKSTQRLQQLSTIRAKNACKDHESEGGDICLAWRHTAKSAYKSWH